MGGWWQTDKVARTKLFPARDEAGAFLGGNLEGLELLGREERESYHAFDNSINKGNQYYNTTRNN